MALTPLPALRETRRSCIALWGFGTGEASAVTAPSREGRAVLREMRKELKDKKRTKMLLFSAPKPKFFSLGQNPIFGGFQGGYSRLLTQSGRRPVIPAKTNNLEGAPRHQSHLPTEAGADPHRGAFQDIPGCQLLPLEAVGMLLCAPAPSGAIHSRGIPQCATSIRSPGAVATNPAAFPRANITI